MFPLSSPIREMTRHDGYLRAAVAGGFALWGADGLA